MSKIETLLSYFFYNPFFSKVEFFVRQKFDTPSHCSFCCTAHVTWLFCWYLNDVSVYFWMLSKGNWMVHVWLSQPSVVERLNSLEKTIISNCENRHWLFIIVLFLLIFKWLWKITLLECIIARVRKSKRLNQSEKKHSQYDKI